MFFPSEMGSCSCFILEILLSSPFSSCPCAFPTPAANNLPAPGVPRSPLLANKLPCFLYPFAFLTT